jgi:hypothetical protein
VRRSFYWIPFFVAVFVPLVAMSHQSLWIDEANSAVKAMQPDLKMFAATMRAGGGSDLQMPFYMLGLWGWEKVAGSTEWALRAFNWPFWLLALLAWRWLPCRYERLTPWLWWASSVSAFLWIYLDEARPYVMQYAGSTMVVVGVLRLSENASGTMSWLLIYVGCLMTAGASLLGVPFVGGMLLLAGWFSWCGGFQGPWRSMGWRMASGVFVLVMAGLALFYGWTLTEGARASGVGRTNLGNVGFTAYELMGFSGLGPGRSVIRQNGVEAFVPYGVPLLALGVLWVAVVGGAIRVRWDAWSGEWKRWVAWGVALGMSAGFVFLLGFLAEFRVVGRHLMPLMSVVLMILAWSFWVNWNRGRWGKVLVLTTLSLMGVSSLGVRFLPTHGKDDYRWVSALVREVLNDGGTVWWAADGAATVYYGIEEVSIVRVRQDGEWHRRPNPDLIVLSKTDVYDRSGALRKWMNDNGYGITAERSGFTVWKRWENPESTEPRVRLHE